MTTVNCGQRGASFVTHLGDTFSVSDVTSLLKLFGALKLRAEIVRRASKHYVDLQKQVTQEGGLRRKGGRPSNASLAAMYPELVKRPKTTDASLHGQLTTEESRAAFLARGPICEVCDQHPVSYRWRLYGIDKHNEHKDDADNMIFICPACRDSLLVQVPRDLCTFSEVIPYLMRFGASQDRLEQLCKRLIDKYEPVYWTAKSGHLREMEAAGQLAALYPCAPQNRTALRPKLRRDRSEGEQEV